MNEEKVNELKEALRIIMQMIVQKGEPISSEIKTMLAQVVDHVGKRIEELRSQESPADGLGPESEVPELGAAPYPSSNINAFKYDYDNNRLFVKFMGKDTANSGPVYKYEGVPRFMYDVFRKGAVGPKTSGSNKYHAWQKGITPSLGAAMHALIKLGGYPYQRMA